MDDFIDFCQHRRSIREFTSQQVDKDDIIDCLIAASFAPSVSDLQPWEVIIVDKVDVRKAVSSCCLGQEWLYDAPVILVVLADMNRVRTYHGDDASVACRDSCVAAIMNILHAAHARKLGAYWVGEFDSKKLSETLSIADHCEIVALVALGHPSTTDIAPKHVDALDEWVYFNEYANTAVDSATRLRDFGEAARDSMSEYTKKSQKRLEEKTKPLAEKFTDQLRDWMNKSEKKK
jgi:nitroreductase